MKKPQRIIALLTAVVMVFALSACGNQSAEESLTNTEGSTMIGEYGEKIRVACSNGAPGFAMLKLIHDRSYACELNFYNSQDEIADLMKTGGADVAAVHIDTAVRLYNETKGAVKVIAVNNLGTLYYVTRDSGVENFEDVRDKTVSFAEKGSVYDAVFRALMKKYDIDPDEMDIRYEKSFSELTDKFGKGGEIINAIIPEPNLSVIAAKEKAETASASQATASSADPEKVFARADITAKWEQKFGTKLTQYCIIARSDFIEKNPEKIKEFLIFNEVATNYMLTSTAAPLLAVKAGYIDSEDVAAFALKRIHLEFLEGEEMKEAVSSTVAILYEQAPELFGGAVPADDFYYSAS